MKKVVKTRLLHKQDLFEVLHCAECTNLPVLLLGEKGVAKTQSFIDYASSNGGEIFMRQLNYDTRAEDLVGYINLPKFKEGIVERINGIHTAKYILLDEVDKASSSVRNLFLSLLREKAIFDGANFVKCNWTLLVGTSNREEFDSEDEAFLDRFVLKYRVPRVGVVELTEAIDKEIEEVEIELNYEFNKDSYLESVKVLKNIIKDLYSEISDRTAFMIKEVLKYYSSKEYMSPKDAVIKSIGLVAGIRTAEEISKKIMSDEYEVLLINIENNYYMSDIETRFQFMETLKKIAKEGKLYHIKGKARYLIKKFGGSI